MVLFFFHSHLPSFPSSFSFLLQTPSKGNLAQGLNSLIKAPWKSWFLYYYLYILLETPQVQCFHFISFSKMLKKWTMHIQCSPSRSWKIKCLLSENAVAWIGDSALRYFHWFIWFTFCWTDHKLSEQLSVSE